MIEPNAPVWQTLYSLGNNANKWFRCLMKSSEENIRKNIEILTADLSHQFSYYSVTTYVLPYLAVFCSKLFQENKVFLITKIRAIIAAESNSTLSPNTEPYHEFQEGLAGFRCKIEHLITVPGISELLGRNPGLGQEFTRSVLSIFGNRKHAYNIYFMSGSCWKEGFAVCTCGWNDEMFSFSSQKACLAAIEISSWDGKTLTDEVTWFHGLLNLAGDKEINSILPLIYGTGVCPNCGKRESYWNWFDRFMKNY